MVLAHVFNRLANLVSILTVHVFKDDWNRPQSYQLMNDNSFLNKGTVASTALNGGANAQSSLVNAAGGGAAYAPMALQQQQGQYKPYVPIAAAAGGFSNAQLATSIGGIPHQNGGARTLPGGGQTNYVATARTSSNAAAAGFKVSNLNPDIMNLLGSTSSSSSMAPLSTSNSAGTAVSINMNHVGSTQAYPMSNPMAGFSTNHVTYSPSARTDPDGAQSKSQ